MSISSEITRLSGNVSDALTAISNKGVTVPSGSNSDDLATLIGQISGGGTGTVVIEDTTDSHGGTIRTITAVDISDTTAVAADVAQGKYFYDATGTKTAGTSTGGGGSLVITDVSNTSGTTAEISVGGSSGSVQTETGTFVGNDANVITISCDFAPDLIYIRGDLTSSASLRGICSITIIKDTAIYVTADSSTSATDEYLLFVAHGITGYNTDTTYPYATYANGILSVDTVMNSGTARWNSAVTYSYKLIGWS